MVDLKPIGSTTKWRQNFPWFECIKNYPKKVSVCLMHRFPQVSFETISIILRSLGLNIRLISLHNIIHSTNLTLSREINQLSVFDQAKIWIIGVFSSITLIDKLEFIFNFRLTIFRGIPRPLWRLDCRLLPHPRGVEGGHRDRPPPRSDPDAGFGHVVVGLVVLGIDVFDVQLRQQEVLCRDVIKLFSALVVIIIISFMLWVIWVVWPDG